MSYKRTIAIVAGGDSSEYQVSLRSAQGLNSFIPDCYRKFVVLIRGLEWSVLVGEKSYKIDKNDFSFVYEGEKVVFDYAYITIHGTPGENGILQGYFRLLNIPFSCCDVLASSLTFAKYACVKYLSSFGINTSNSVMLRRGEEVDVEAIVEQVGLPCFVKPEGAGSSFGVTKVKSAQQMKEAVEKAFVEDSAVMIERMLVGTEVTCGMYKTKKVTRVFPITEVVTDNEFFDYDAKYNGQVDEITPARVSKELTEKVQATTARIYDYLGAKGIIRVDYIIDNEDNVNLLEVNTTPGMTVTSFIPQQIRAAGLDIAQVMEEIIEDAF